MGVGECAGEVVSPAEFALTAADREVFEAQILLDKGSYAESVNRAFSAMLQAANGLLLQIREPAGDTAAAIVGSFREHFFDTEVFFDPFRGGSIAQYFFDAHENLSNGGAQTQESAHQVVEEAILFLEGAQSCRARLLAAKA
jgi:sulfite reductase (ferredoxin)